MHRGGMADTGIRRSRYAVTEGRVHGLSCNFVERNGASLAQAAEAAALTAVSIANVVIGSSYS